MWRAFLASNGRSYRPWIAMIAANAAVMIAALLFRYMYGENDQYAHLLVNYHDGFLKRALIGEIVSLVFSPTVPIWLVYGLGTAVWLAALLLFLKAFRRIVGFSEQALPMFVLMFASPAFLKNFIDSLGYFDIYGCIVALLMLTIPARSVLYVVIAGAASCVLILIHHVHFLMYLPTIAIIVIIRHYCMQRLAPATVAAGVVLAAQALATFLLSQFYGSPRIPEADFQALLQSRMTVPGAKILTNMWYLTLDQEIVRTWLEMPKNAPRIPVYVALAAAHWPLIGSFRDNLRRLDNPLHRRIVTAGLAGVTLAYAVIFAVVFDYARWTSNWIVCMFLLLLATRCLPRRSEPEAIRNSGGAQATGWLLTILPRVGIIRPF